MNLADLQTLAQAPAQIPPQAAGFTFYPLRSLIASPANVRSSDKRTPQVVLEMALSIAAHGGLLQNLVVVPELKDGERTGRAAVTAGETRRQALVLLASGKVPDVEGFDLDFPVPVREVADEEGAASSATENILRTQMHPADQFKAFAELHDQCGSVEHVASMFGVTPLVVQRRLKLAAASPKLFEVYRTDGMTLEQLMALCISDDHAAQERVWEATKGRTWDRNAENLRRMLTQQDVAATDPLVRFVTVKAYEAAGGKVRRDMFSDEGEGFLTNAPLLQELAGQKLEKAASTVRKEGWAWVEVRTEVVDSYNLNGFTKAQQGLTMNEAQRAEMARLEADRNAADSELDLLYEREDAGEECEELRSQRSTLSVRVRELGAAMEKLQASCRAWTPEVLGHAGVVIALDRQGKVAVHRGLVRPEDRKAATKAVAAADAKEQAERGERGEGAAPAKAQESGKLPESLMRRLTAHRTIALQRMLADNTHVALAVLAHNLVQRVMGGSYGYRTATALDLQAKTCSEQLKAATDASIEQARAWTELEALRETWGERMPGDADKLLPWLIGLPMTDLCDLIALCTAQTLNAVTAFSNKHEADPLAQALGLDMADWWKPTGDEYLSRVPKASIIEVLKDAGKTEDAALAEKMKKGEAVAKAEQALAASRWLPKALRAKE